MQLGLLVDRCTARGLTRQKVARPLGFPRRVHPCPAALHDLETALEGILDCFRVGRSTILSSLFRPRIDRILFAVDYPFVANAPAVQWIDTIPLCDEDKIKLLSGNAKRLLRL